MNSKLFVKVSKGEERTDRIKTFQVFPVAAFYLAVMSGRVRADQFMLDAQLGGSFLKKCRDVAFAVGKTVGKLKTVVGLDAFN